jgi:hypothetical protein
MVSKALAINPFFPVATMVYKDGFPALAIMLSNSIT